VNSDRELAKAACSYCGKPVYCDEGIHGISLDHYDCYAGVIGKMDSIMDGITGTRRKRHKAEGEGVIAKKVIAMATAAIEEELGAKIYNIRFWNQKGGYRGQSWDLARWGFYFDVEGTTLKGNCHSWSRMTDCVKAKKLTAHLEDITYTFNVEP
jgi:hypothetical protein